MPGDPRLLSSLLGAGVSEVAQVDHLPGPLEWSLPEGRLEVLLIQAAHGPHAGSWRPLGPIPVTVNSAAAQPAGKLAQLCGGRVVLIRRLKGALLRKDYQADPRLGPLTSAPAHSRLPLPSPALSLSVDPQCFAYFLGSGLAVAAQENHPLGESPSSPPCLEIVLFLSPQEPEWILGRVYGSAAAGSAEPLKGPLEWSPPEGCL